MVVHDADGDPIGTVTDQVVLDGNIHIDPFNLGLCILSGCANDLSVTNTLLQQASLELEAKKTASFGQQWNVLWLPLTALSLIHI